MKFIEDIRIKIGNYFLEKDSSQLNRNRAIYNLEDAKTFGILFDSSNMEDIELVKKYVTYLKEMHKKVKVIGYYSTEIIPEFTYSKLEYDFFSRKELNWYFKPSGNFVEDFIAEEFDVLLDLNVYDQMPLKYISSLSKAKFKVGKFSMEKNNIFDMMIEKEDSKGFKYFLRQVDTYMTMINKSLPKT